MIATFNRFEIELTKDQALLGYHTGECISDVRELLKDPKIRTQLLEIPFSTLVEELAEYGCWTKEELLSDLEGTYEKVIWLAAGDISEQLACEHKWSEGSCDKCGACREEEGNSEV